MRKNKPLRVGMDVASLSDKALTGIPLYVESLLREYLKDDGPEEWVLAGSQLGTDLREQLLRRGISLDKNLPQLVPASDFRIASHLPALGSSPATGWLVRKVDGRVLLPLGNQATSRRVPPVDVMHHTAILRIEPSRARKNIVTIYDLTTRFYPETHGRVNIHEWERVFAFGRDRADLVITDSESAKQDIIEHLKIPAERIKVILLGVRPLPTNLPLETIQAVQQKFSLTTNRFILAAGSLEPRKNLPRLIEAFALLARDPQFADVRLVLTGAKLHGVAAIEQTMQENNLSERVVLTGYATDEELAALMQTCDAFVYPSVYEGFGLPVVEAMAMGAPVATSNLSSLPEVAGDAALLFDPKSVPAIAECLKHILSDVTLVAQLREKGKRRAAQFSWKRCADEHREVYRMLGDRY